MLHSKPNIRAMWLGPQDDVAQVAEALKQHHALLPIQNNGEYQHIADAVRRKLGSEEIVAFPEKVRRLVADLPNAGYDNVARDLLLALDNGGDVWEWGIAPRLRNGRNCYAYGWCIVREGQIVASLCHSTS